MYEWHGFNIKNLPILSPAMLAPMAGVTGRPFRVICAKQGAGLVGMEMVSAKALLQGNAKSFEMLSIDECEHPVSLQLFGASPDIIGEAIRRIDHVPYDILDINMGCPMPKITGNGEGSALLLDIVLAKKIIESAVAATNRPVSVKIRKGFYENDNVAQEFAKMAQDAGAAAITVHGRTRAQMYAGRADWQVIKDVKSAVSIPVIGNGDVNSPQSAVKMLEFTGCDGVMIGRGARGNPWLFKAVAAYIANEELLEKPDYEEIKAMIINHAKMQIAAYGEKIGILEMRKQAGWYIAGCHNAAQMRNSINQADSLEELISILQMSQEV